MISKQIEPHKNTLQFILRPNSSLSWQNMKSVFYAVAGVLAVISGAFSLMGLWLVFPFAGLELIALGAAFYLCARRAQCWEMITIDQSRVEVFRSCKKNGETWKFHRYWTRVRVESSQHAWYMSHLIIGSHGYEVEVGVFLTEEERLHLAEELQKVCGLRQ